ncbi:MAG: PepSY-like domain-containing protein [Bacteroidaceae bacterium]|nr:PepSY-like domain-containing protein [Bacteroidaceae bacterium]
MKKTLFAIACLFTLGSASLLADRPVQKEQLPTNVKEFLTKHFPNVEVSYAKQDNELFDKDFTVVLTNGDKLEFTSKGEWKEADCEYNRVPEALIPVAIRKYVSENQKGNYVVEIKKERRHYDVKLNNKLELEFSLDGKLLKYD